MGCILRRGRSLASAVAAKAASRAARRSAGALITTCRAVVLAAGASAGPPAVSYARLQPECALWAPGQRAYSPASGASAQMQGPKPAGRPLASIPQLRIQPTFTARHCQPLQAPSRAPQRAPPLPGSPARPPTLPTAGSPRRGTPSHEHQAGRGLRARRGCGEPQRAAALPDKDVSVGRVGSRLPHPPPRPRLPRRRRRRSPNPHVTAMQVRPS